MTPTLSPAMEEKVREAFGRLLMEVSPDGDVTDPDDWSNTLRDLILAAVQETARRCKEIADTYDNQSKRRLTWMQIRDRIRKEFLSDAS